MPKNAPPNHQTKPTTSQSSFTTAPRPSKDYASAFAGLQSSFGVSGAAPCLPPKTSKQYSSMRSPSLPSSSSSSLAPAPHTSSKDYAAAFGMLLSASGFSGSSAHSQGSLKKR